MDREMRQTRATSGNGPKACTTCAKAKARCCPGPTEGICERCHRLKKSCSSQTPAPPRKRKAAKPTRVAELEKRLEDLTARVESRQPRPLTPEDGDSAVETEGPQRKTRRYSFPNFNASRHPRLGYSHLFPPDEPDHHAHHREQDLGHQRQTNPNSDGNNTRMENPTPRRIAAGDTVGESDSPLHIATQPQRSERTANSNTSSSFGASIAGVPPEPQQKRIPSCRFSKGAQLHRSSGHDGSLLGAGAPEIEDPWYYPSSDEAQHFLVDFDTHLVPLFPFVVMPPNMTSATLRRDRPLLWKAVMMQGLHLDARRQVSMGDELLHDIVATAFLQSRKSLDLLQALELLLAWFYMGPKSFQLTNFLFLMRSICVSLGFNESQQFSKQQEHTWASLEQIRAFTGAYYLVTMVFTTNKKPDAFMNTTYLDYCCRTLEEKMQCPTDRLVVLLVQTQQLSQSISMTLAFRNTRDSLPLSLIIQSFQHEIGRLRDAIPDDLRNSTALISQMHIAEVILFEAGLSEDLSAGLGPTERLELLWGCLNATKSMLEARFRTKVDRWPRSIALACFDYTYAMLVCLRLSLLQLPGWDLRLVRKELDFDKFLTMQIVELEIFTSLRRRPRQADRGSGPTGGAPGLADFQDPFVHLHTRLSHLRTCILADLSASLPPDPQQSRDCRDSRDTTESPADTMLVDGAVAAPGSSMSPASGDFFSDDAMQGLDDPFWQELYKSNEWETSFSAILGWGYDDTTVPNYSNWTTDM